MIEYIKKQALKRKLKEKGFQIGSKTLLNLIKSIETDINEKIEIITRKSKISGRKTIKISDLKH